jgi:hypothetical protein
VENQKYIHAVTVAYHSALHILAGALMSYLTVQDVMQKIFLKMQRHNLKLVNILIVPIPLLPLVHYAGLGFVMKDTLLPAPLAGKRECVGSVILTMTVKFLKNFATIVASHWLMDIPVNEDNF